MGSAGGYALGMREPPVTPSELAPAGVLTARMQVGKLMLLAGWQSQDSHEPRGALAATPSPFAASARFAPRDVR